jgi:hypothetical protein
MVHRVKLCLTKAVTQLTHSNRSQAPAQPNQINDSPLTSQNCIYIYGIPPESSFFSPHLSARVVRRAVKRSSELAFLLVENYQRPTPIAHLCFGEFLSQTFSIENSAFHCELFVGAAVKKRGAVAMSSAIGTV